MVKKKTKISYGKNVYNNQEINAVNKTLKNSTQMGKSVNSFESKISKLESRIFSNNSLNDVLSISSNFLTVAPNLVA